MSITLKCDSTQAQKKLDRINKGIATTMPQVGRFSGKVMAFRMGEYTLPTSKNNDWPVEKLMSRIEDDIENAYPSKADRDWEYPAFDLLKQYKGEEIARKFWAAYKGETMVSGKGDGENPMLEADMIFKRANIPKQINQKSQQLLKKSKFGYKGSVYRLIKQPYPVAMVQQDRRDNFIARQKKRAGLAKSAWWQSATALGGTNNYNRSQNEEGKFVWPKEAAKVQAGQGNNGIGEGSIINAGSKVITTIRSNLRYATEALPMHLREIALRLAGVAIKKNFDLRFRNGFRKGTWKEAA